MSVFTFFCRGHPNITALHPSTIEFTSDTHMTEKGDCIIGVESSGNLFVLPTELKDKLRKRGSKITVQIETGDMIEQIKGEGSPDLELSDKNAIIIRKSAFTDPKTLMIKADKSAKDLSREIIENMKDGNSSLKITIQI